MMLVVDEGGVLHCLPADSDGDGDAVGDADGGDGMHADTGGGEGLVSLYASCGMNSDGGATGYGRTTPRRQCREAVVCFLATPPFSLSAVRRQHHCGGSAAMSALVATGASPRHCCV